MTLIGLHHVTATVDDAQDDLDFCLGGLGLRLVKKTVNFDNHHVYHFYYGDERGTPGTIWTTFPYKDRGVRVGAKGAGQVTVDVVFGARRLARVLAAAPRSDRSIAATDVEPRFGEPAIRFSDPRGLIFELVAHEHDASDTVAGRRLRRGLRDSRAPQRDDGRARRDEDARSDDRPPRLRPSSTKRSIASASA